MWKQFIWIAQFLDTVKLVKPTTYTDQKYKHDTSPVRLLKTSYTGS